MAQSLQRLRAELKKWETKFAATNKGKKPSREDIKQNHEIAQKYKEYNKIRATHSSDAQPSVTATTVAPSPRKRKATAASASSTPSKRARPAETPRKGAGNSQGGIYVDATTPSTARRLFGTPTIPTSVGPTPQRDGRVLGLFDVLDSPNVRRTPSKSTGGAHLPGAHATPPGQAPSPVPDGQSGDACGARLDRTPMSSSKRNALNNFMTPLGRRDANAFASLNGDLAAGEKTPSSATKLLFATPAFLRRAPPPPEAPRLDEEAPVSRSLFPTRRPLFRSVGRPLSGIVAELRSMEEEKLDEDLEALHEMEAEMVANSGRKPPENVPKPRKAAEAEAPEAADKEGPERVASTSTDPGTVVGNPQVPRPTLPLGGFDDEAMYDSAPEDGEGLDRNGQPLRVFKKKGQKRTTRRANMRPVRTKRPSDAPAVEDCDEDEVVPETQHQIGVSALDEEDTQEVDAASGSDFSGPESDEEAGSEDGAPSKARGKNNRKTATEKGGGKAPITGEGKSGGQKAGAGSVTGRIAKKISAVAHQNFRRLKLRNNGAKGGPGFNSRFRRRR